jgi:soluble cytochrome b562
MIETTVLIQAIDEFLVALGTTEIVDAKKARDQLIDLRLMLMADLEAPDVN